MTSEQRLWSESRNRLAREVTKLGYPAEFADLLARELGSPKAIGRMASHLAQARPGSIELIVDEMLAILSETEAWREKKTSRDAQAGYSVWLRSEERIRSAEQE